MWQDEVGAARVMVARGIVDLLRGVVAAENHPPGYYTLGWVVHALGAPVVWNRAFSVAAAALVAAGVVLYSRRLLPLELAAVAGLTVALGWQFERHGWELRPYALFALAALTFAWALEWVAADPTRGRSAILATIVALGSMIHYFFAFTVAAGVIWLLASGAPHRRRRLLVAIGVGLVPLVVWAPAFAKQWEQQHFATLPAFHVRGVIDLYAALLERSLPAGATGILLGAGVLALVLIGALRLWRDHGRGRLCALATVVPVAVTALLWLAGPHVFQPRALIGVAPFAAVCLAAGLSLPRRSATIAAAFVAIALLTLGFSRGDNRIVPHYDRVADALIAEGWRPGDPIMLFGSVYDYLHPLDWYLPGSERLEIVEPDRGGCSRVFIVAVGGKARALTAPLGDRVWRIDSIVVGALPWRPSLWNEVRRRHGNVLAALNAPCAGARSQTPRRSS